MVAFAQDCGIEDHINMNFDYFQIPKWMSEAVRVEKVDKKNGIISLVFMFLSEVMALKLSKKSFFAILCWLQQET